MRGGRPALALLWLALVAAAALHVGLAWSRGLPLQTDLMALLPREDRDPVVGRAKDAVTRAVSQRVLLLVGHADRAAARSAAAAIEDALTGAGLLEAGGDVPAAEALRRLGAAYFPHRAGLLAEPDRRALDEGRGETLVTRALSQVYGFGGMADGRLLERDPFLLFPAFLGALPLPASRLSLDEGRPAIVEDGTTWVLVAGRLAGEIGTLALQRRFDEEMSAALAAHPEARVLRLGSLFYAHAAAEQALWETSAIGGVSVAGTVLLLLLAFRASAPLLLSVAAIGAGMVTALSASLLLFGEPHVAGLLLGSSLIGVTVDYALHYFCQRFAGIREPRARLARVLPGLVLGLLTTLVGYGALALAPLPGLRQVAVFSIVGLVASFLTVALWFPLLDRTPPAALGRGWRRFADGLWRFWAVRRAGWLAVLALTAVGGLAMLTVEDDIRRQQSLSPLLMAEQAELQRLAGFAPTTQFFVVEGADTETALRREEALGERLRHLPESLSGWQSPARFVPSAGRQRADAALVAERLARPHLAAYRASLGMPSPEPEPPDAAGTLPLSRVLETGALPLLSALVLGEGEHLVLLEGLRDPGSVREAAAGLEGVRFVDPTADITDLLGAYRRRAVALLAASAVLMVPLLALRYGLAGALRVMAPPAAAVVLAPALLALAGLPFTFFSAMALVLVLSVGVDYAVFCAEEGASRDPVTLTAATLAMLTTVLAFGLLALSGVAGVRAFGAVMMVGIPLALALAPLAARVRR